MTTFHGTVQLDGKTATGIVVPDHIVEEIGGGKQPLVSVTIGEHSWDSRVFVRGGVFKLPVSAANRAGAGVAAGDEVYVTIAAR